MQFDKEVGEVHLLEWANAQEGERRGGGQQVSGLPVFESQSLCGLGRGRGRWGDGRWGGGGHGGGARRNDPWTRPCGLFSFYPGLNLNLLAITV
jgi:hypothetical protein